MRSVTLRRWIPAFAILGLITASCGAGGTAGSSSAPIPARNAAEAGLLPTDAGALPQFDLATYQRLLDELRGTPVLVNFWGSWCGPCRDEAPRLAAAHDRFGDRVQFLGVDILDARESARGFMREYHWTYPSVYDPGGAIRDGLGLLGQPVTLLYDRTGAIVHRWIGPAPSDELTTQLERIASA
jgi:thiol-disulfide isomerase/thioredoxin